MAPSDVAVRPRRSAFAAAFLSFIFPGLGHAYLGRWLRALLWAALPIIGIAAVAGLGMSYTRDDLIELVADPDFLTALLLFLVFDTAYRFAAVIDAYRLGSDTGVGNASTRILSLAGLIALSVVLVGSHVAIARPVMYANDLYAQLENNAGDESEVLTEEELIEQGGDDFVLNTEELTENASPKPGGRTERERTNEPTQEPTEEPTPEAEVTEEPTEEPKTAEWDGKERLNILLIGQDGGRQGINDGSLLTDTMITISVDPTTGRLAFISLPRDASNIPLPRSWPAYRALGGKWNNKINTLYAQARSNASLFPGNNKNRGYNALMGALGELYGLDIKYYMAVDLNSFRSVVGSLGGVVVDVQLPVMDTAYSTGDGRGKLKLYVPPGMTKMNGQDALAYARSRHGSSDFDRSARQQRVVTSVRDQTDIGELLVNPSRVTELINQLSKDVKTNIPPKLVPKMLSLARELDLDNRENLVLSSGKYVETCYPCGSSGLWMLKAKPAAIKGDVKNVFSTSKSKQRQINRVRDEEAVVYVLNGQGGQNTKSINIASNLSGRGMNAIVPPVNGGKAENGEFTGTIIRVYNGANEEMPETFKRLKNVLNDKQRTVEFIDNPNAQADFTVIVGSKTKGLKA